MSELNASQQRMIDTLEGMVVVDAGPGTGKTHTIVERYVKLLGKEDVNPRDILMMTFTRNAASEMEQRIKARLRSVPGMEEKSKLVQVKTFDAFCLSVVMDSPEDAGALFGIQDKLTHSARLVENETLNKRHFSLFLDDFLHSHGEDYGDWSIIGGEYPDDLYQIINRLMSRGIYPVKGNGWFGNDPVDILSGDVESVLGSMRELNEFVKKGRSARSYISSRYHEMGTKDYDVERDPESVEELPDSILKEAAFDDRSEFFRFIHDAYWHYLRRSISEDRLTFGINAMLAFSILYSNDNVRKINSYRYVMIDEFQDTNSSQLMLSLLVLKEPNLCVVGDWKQGIYGFRFVSIDNILDFDRRAKLLADKLNEDRGDGNRRVAFRIPETVKIQLDTNYRSSEKIVDKAFECMTLKATANEKIDTEAIESNLARLTAKRQKEIGDRTHIRYVRCESSVEEARMVGRCVREYLQPGRYPVVDKEGERPMRLGDIAVLCRTTSGCRAVVDELTAQGIPAYLYGEVELMCTREAKLVLAWLRYINNSFDPWGYIPIMVDQGYSLAECDAARRDNSKIPSDISGQRRELYAKRRRITELLTNIFVWYGIDNDVSQSVINVLSGAHRDSLLTISDLISMIEEDMEGKPTTYPVETDLTSDAVAVMSMHKSKGLEFPTVIMPFIDPRIMPNTNGDRSAFLYDEVLGLRPKNVVAHYNGYSRICKSWRTYLCKSIMSSDYDEERRLMFVSMTRAKQYETLISGPEPSEFMKGLSKENYSEIEDCPLSAEFSEFETIQKPEIGEYVNRTQTIGVHSIMSLDLEDGQGGMAEIDEICGKGKEYGTSVHLEAQLMHVGVAPSGKYPETDYIAGEVLSRRSMEGFLKSYSEIGCSLPVCSGTTILKGQIDLLMVFDDRVEIHDYKTDVTDRFQAEYELQLSVYAHAAEGYYNGLPVRCFIDYVSQGRTVEFEPLSMEDIDKRVAESEARRLQLRRTRSQHYTGPRPVSTRFLMDIDADPSFRTISCSEPL